MRRSAGAAPAPAAGAAPRPWWLPALLLCSVGRAAPFCEEGNCRRGTFDYVAQRFYQSRVGTPDSQLDGLHLTVTSEHMFTAYLDESAPRQTGAHIVGDAGVVLGDSVYFATFDFDGSLQKYSSSLSFQEELHLGGYGGQYFSAVASLGSSHLVLGTGGTPGRILTVETDPAMQYVSAFACPADVGGVLGLATDGTAVLVLVGSPPARVLLLQASPDGNLTLEDTLTISDDDEISAPVSPNFLDTQNDIAYVATRKGCFFRIKYASWELELDSWGSSCSTQVSGLFGLAADSGTQKAVVISVSPYRQLAVLSLSSGLVEQTLPLSKDLAYVTNLFITSPASGSVAQAIIVGQSRRSIPAIMQVNLGSGDLGSSWGLIAGGICDEYSWTEDKRIVWVEGTEHRRYPARYYGCIWVPLGRQATGAAISNEKLYLATERTRCTVCTTDEPVFGSDEGFCVEEHEEYRAPAAKCGQEAHNTRPLIWERALSYDQLQHLTNQLYGAVNTSIMSFQIGEIPKIGGMYAPKIASGAPPSGPAPWLTVVALVVILALLPGVEATTTKSFHQSEEGCNCLRNCEIFDMGDCSDDTETNRRAFEEAWAKLPDGSDNLCKALQAMAFCSVRQAELDVGHEEVVLCQGIAKQIGCEVDCGGAARRGRRWILPSAVLVAVAAAALA
ncbi:unnamed protein product [Prorocentrum cordatum]|uniref:Uncharacterized protein n=1 Tax=Prorocentrum cordatum TaxID=2364126 RepID=A0ABN9XSI7_9DINO|nr:unnamed protein product [Polarella glacialis]